MCHLLRAIGSQKIMISRLGIVLLFCCLFLTACFTDNPPAPPVDPADSLSIDSKVIRTEQLKGHPISLVITSPSAAIYEAPSRDSTLLTTLVMGDSLVFTNEITQENYTFQQNGHKYREPWLRIILPDNRLGWVHAAHICFEGASHSALKQRVLEQRAKGWLGQSLTQLMGVYAKESQQLQTLPAFQLLYRRSEIIKDSVTFYLNNWRKRHPKQDVPDFYWINELTPAMLLHDIKEKEQFYLFRNLADWQQFSQATASTEDDRWVEVLLEAYSSDSIEYYFADWRMPIDDKIVCSTLGSGKHTAVLTKIDAALDSNGYFRDELEEVKQAIVDDISISAHYWLSLESVLAEIDTILLRDFVVLNSNDKTELKIRRQIIRNHEENNIQLNLFEGN